MKKIILIILSIVLITSTITVFAEDKDNYKLYEKDGKKVYEGRPELVNQFVEDKIVLVQEWGTIYDEFTGETTSFNHTVQKLIPQYIKVPKYKYDKTTGKLYNDKKYKEKCDSFPTDYLNYIDNMIYGVIEEEPEAPTPEMFEVQPIKIITGASLKSGSQVREKSTGADQEIQDEFGTSKGDFIWVDGVNEAGTIIFPNVYDKMFVATGNYEKPIITEIYQNNILPYYEIKSGKTYVYTPHFSGAGGIWVSVNLTLHYQPQDILFSYDSTMARITDNSSSGLDGVIVWGGFPTGVSSVMGSLVSDYTASYGVTGVTQDIVPVTTPPDITADAIKTAALATDPFIEGAEAIEEITNNRIPVLLTYWWFYIFLAIVLFAWSYAMLDNLILAGLLFCTPIGYAVSRGVVDWYVIPALVLWLAGCVVLEQRRVVA